MRIVPYRLTELHGRLDDKIRSELKRYSFDQFGTSAFRLIRLRQLRLRVKNRLKMLTLETIKNHRDGLQPAHAG